MQDVKNTAVLIARSQVGGVDTGAATKVDRCQGPRFQKGAEMETGTFQKPVFKKYNRPF